MPAVALWMHIMHANFVIYFVNNIMYICRLIELTVLKLLI